MFKCSIWNYDDIHFVSSKKKKKFFWFYRKFYHLFQTVDDARQLFKHIDSSLGVPLPDKDYGGNCLIYDSEVLDNPFHNFWVFYWLNFFF